METETIQCNCCREPIDFSQGAFFDADLGKQVCKACAENLVKAKSELKRADMLKCAEEPK